MKHKKKVWVDINEVVKVAEVPKKVRWIVEVMEEVPNTNHKENSSK